MIDNQAEWEVDKILDERTIVEEGSGQKIHQLLVKWVGYDDADNSWEPADAFKNAHKALMDFGSQRKTNKRPSRHSRPYAHTVKNDANRKRLLKAIKQVSDSP
ncbi:hypothetical protein COEREDRAFT_8406 [Coemansia reversa NRRL 1564]|uniref:Chromo domain-containing protein n=1 Tax=Coemansia reversa (strain ATCC 12441 / NRRL 1564) TaxID=763665 RepID=A0A2G5BC78_COERN|nr:hypothetical protein COEREDRAFT_8406 [Coemansia reversa NRRL 1564]|eukprot:PIA16616.1 hypothetical protein COEREDRAFT_8406 [Coemansia reversa NRRL 1564]